MKTKIIEWILRFFGFKKKENPDVIEDVYFNNRETISYDQLPVHHSLDYYNYKPKGGIVMGKREVKLNATVNFMSRSEIVFEFGRVQATMEISGTGSAARKLKLKEGDKVQIVLKTLGGK